MSQPYPEAPLTRDHVTMALKCPTCGRTGLAVWPDAPREGLARESAPPTALLCHRCQTPGA